MYDKTFIDDCLNGDATLFNLDDYIEYWHTHDTELSLQDFLGMTDYEFETWGKNSDAIIRDILRCRRESIDFSGYSFLTDSQRLAARSYDQDSIDELTNEGDNENEE